MKYTNGGNVLLTTLSDEHVIPINILCHKFRTSMNRALSSEQAKQILKQNGKNTIQPPPTTIRGSFRDKLGSPYSGKFTKAEWQRLIGRRIPTEVCVIRDGRQQWIPGKKLVCGDMVILKKHDFIPADIRLVASKCLTVDNRLITGTRSEMKEHVSYTRDCLLSPNMVFCCTKVVEGCGVGVVLRTGEDTVFGTLKNFATRVRFDAVIP